MKYNCFSRKPPCWLNKMPALWLKRLLMADWKNLYWPVKAHCLQVLPDRPAKFLIYTNPFPSFTSIHSHIPKIVFSGSYSMYIVQHYPIFQVKSSIYLSHFRFCHVQSSPAFPPNPTRTSRSQNPVKMRKISLLYCTSNRFAVINYNERPPAVFLPWMGLQIQAVLSISV